MGVRPFAGALVVCALFVGCCLGCVLRCAMVCCCHISQVSPSLFLCCVLLFFFRRVCLQYRTGGMASLFRGWWMTVLRDAPAFALYFWSYNSCKSWFVHRAVLRGDAPSTGSLIGPLPLMVSGGVAGLTSWAVLHPIDVIKTLTQRVPHTQTDVKLGALIKDAYNKDGIRFATRGFLPTCMRAVPASAITFLVYEWCVWLGSIGTSPTM